MENRDKFLNDLSNNLRPFSYKAKVVKSISDLIDWSYKENININFPSGQWSKFELKNDKTRISVYTDSKNSTDKIEFVSDKDIESLLVEEFGRVNKDKKYSYKLKEIYDKPKIDLIQLVSAIINLNNQTK
jgi:hypothetical protein